MSKKLLREFIRHSLSATREPNGVERTADTFDNLGSEDDLPAHLKNINADGTKDDLGPVPPEHDENYAYITSDPYARFTGV